MALIQHQFVDITPDSINVSSSTPNWFIHSGSGSDAINVSGGNGNNVLDGSTGSNFLVGGSGIDTFFVDARGLTFKEGPVWSSVINFHSGDAATLWGISSKNALLDWANNEGAPGASGLTLHANKGLDTPTASLTLAGYSSADLSNGKLSVSFGNVGGFDYLYVKAS